MVDILNSGADSVHFYRGRGLRHRPILGKNEGKQINIGVWGFSDKSRTRKNVNKALWMGLRVAMNGKEVILGS